MFRGMGASDRIRFIKAQTLAAFHRNNPTTPDTGSEASSGTTLLLRKVGTQTSACGCNTPVCESVCELIGALFLYYTLTGGFSITDLEGFLLTDTGQSITIPYPPGYPNDRNAYCIVFGPSCNATQQSVVFTVNGNPVTHTDYYLGTYNSNSFGPQTGFLVFYPTQDTLAIDDGSLDVVLTVSNACSESSVDVSYGCFLEGAPVTMADGTTKPIESVVVGDVVRGAFGELNTVEALHQPLVGASRLCNINNEHRSTTHHPHISADKKFYVVDPAILANMTYGKKHTVILADGSTERRTMPGVAKERLLKLTEGIVLQTVTGPRAVTSITYEPISPFTKVYHLVVGGSHTFLVEGYAVTGWATEADFDYDAWTPKV